RDATVTGVQTCALPIFAEAEEAPRRVPLRVLIACTMGTAHVAGRYGDEMRVGKAHSGLSVRMEAPHSGQVAGFIILSPLMATTFAVVVSCARRLRVETTRTRCGTCRDRGRADATSVERWWCCSGEQSSCQGRTITLGMDNGPGRPTRMLRVTPLVTLLLLIALPLTAHGWDRGDVDRFATLPAGTSHPEGITVDRQTGDVYVADFEATGRAGPVVVFDPKGGTAAPWVTDARLGTTGVPPFGANGLAFNHARTALYVANTGNDTVVKIAVNNGKSDNPTAGPVIVFVNSINGADGLIVDDDDNIWVCANQADELVVIEPTQGRVIAKLGDFDGIGRDGAPIGFLFPASLVVSATD